MDRCYLSTSTRYNMPSLYHLVMQASLSRVPSALGDHGFTSMASLVTPKAKLC